MYDIKKFLTVCGIALLLAPALQAQALKGMSLNGATGLYSIPSARTGWERSSDFGLDLGFHSVIKDRASAIPALSMSLFKLVELSGAVDIQPDWYSTKDDDLIFGGKIQLPVTNTAVALGGNFQSHNLGNDYTAYNAGQIYIAVTYAGSFFDMPAETTVVLGKTFRENNNNSNIDFGMGFDLILFPRVLRNYVHWITDFANFSYSYGPWGADANIRGVLNTGLRINLALIPALAKFKFNLDILMADAFDDSRSFSIGAVFGIPVL